MTVHAIDSVVARVRLEVKKSTMTSRVVVSTEDVTRLCDEIEKLERDVELAKQDWRS